MPGKRKLLPVFITMPPNERARLVAFAHLVGRPIAWVVRDALTNYLDAVEQDAGKIAKLQTPKLAMPEVAKAHMIKMGRPRKGAK